MARPPKLTPELHQAIVDRVASGSHPEYAAESVGVTARTYYRWMRKGRAAKSGRFCQFCQAIKKALAREQIENVFVLKRAMKGGQLIEERTVTKKDGTSETTKKYARGEWTAAAWLLERKYPDLWGLRSTKALAAMKEQLAEMERRLNALTQPPTQNPKPAARLHRASPD